MTVTISLAKCLEKVLEPSQARRYVKFAKKEEGITPKYSYNSALRCLNAKDSEGAIYYLISSLEDDRGHEPSLHLVKTMLFGLSKKFHDDGGENYKIKYVTLINWINSIEKKISENEKQIILLRNEKKKQVDKGFWGVLEKIFFKKSVKNYDLLINNLIREQAELKKSLNFASRLSRIEEYAKVLSLILEICLYPARYAWVIG